MTELVVVAFATGFFRDGRVVLFHHDLAQPAARARRAPPAGSLTVCRSLPKDHTVYLVCQGGGRSGKAVDLLGAAGYDVRSAAGGTSAWIESGGEVTNGSGQG